MKYCSQCISKYDDQQRFCLDDGAELVPDPFFLSGQLLGGKFQIESLIDMGGMGAVYRAKHRFLNLPLAFKIVRPDQASSFLIRLFEKEAQTAAPLRHPNIVEISDAGRVTAQNSNGEAVEISYLAMEWLEGRTLDKELREQRNLNFHRLLEVVQQICAALAFAHDKLTIHRDLKPANIMLARLPNGSERIKVLDFGIGKVMSNAHGTNVTATGGTIYYSSPEQLISGARIDHRSDIYSLGVMVFELLTGRLPQTIPLPLLRSWLPDAPAALEDLLKQMTAQEPDDRPHKISEIPILFEQAYRSQLPPLQTFEFETVTVNDTGKIIARHLKTAQSFTEDLGASVKLEMVRIPAGTFLMGSSPDEAERRDSEGPQHRVPVSKFFMGRYAITREQWRQVAQISKVKIALDKEPSHFKDSWQQPVEQINWHEAVEFCARLAQKTGKAWRLPSEAEWEYAARAGTITPFAFGETITPEIVNYNGDYPYGLAAKGEFRQKTIPVGSLGVANAFGLYDLHGNVWEWCEDVWHKDYNDAPKDGSAWATGGDQNYWVLRGGSWDFYGWICRAAYRGNNGPGDRYNSYGFRVVVSARTRP